MKHSSFQRINTPWLILHTAFHTFFEDKGLFLAGALAFNLLLYLFPLLLLMVSLLGYTVLDSDRAMNEVQLILKAFLPRSQQALADNLTAVVANRGLLGFFGFLSFFIFSTFLFGSVRTALNSVFRIEQERSLVHGFGIDLFMMGLTALLLLLAVAASWFLALAAAVVERYPSWTALTQPGLIALSKVIGIAVTIVLFYVLYRFPPATTISTQGLVMASVTGTLLFQLAKWGFIWYVAAAKSNVELYGALGGVIVLLVWLYYASGVFILGAEIGKAYDRRRSSPQL